MFRLQKLEITGFKSFADYTEIIFTETGITAIVGPNGCGKSNFSEAVAWVLGEQSAKHLRGGEMRDVIFQGSKNRQPSGMAEVVLHLVRDETPNPIREDVDDLDEALAEFDTRTGEITDFQGISPAVIETNGFRQTHETNGLELIKQPDAPSDSANEPTSFIASATGTATALAKIPAKKSRRPSRFAFDFAPNEVVTITRRLYRSGDSEYLLNGKTCRLRDIQDLFSGTGLSGSHYAIIEQGRIGQILSAKPSDRRTLIEEAAGITKFRTRQRAAELRLESAKNNLRRLSDIVGEIDKQVNSLRRQAAKTRRYKILREDFRELLRLVFTAEGLELEATLAKLHDEIAFVTKNEQNALNEVGEIEKLFRKATDEARQAEESLTELREEIAENNFNRDRKQRDLQYKTESVANLQERLTLLKGEIKNGENRLRTISEDVKRLRIKNLEAQSDNTSDEAELKKEEEIYQKTLAAVRVLEAEAEKVRSELFQHGTAFERFGEILRQLENTSERLAEQLLRLNRETERANQTHAENTEKLKILQTEITAKREKTNSLKKLQQTRLQYQKEARENLQIAEKERQKEWEEFARNQNRLETLREVEAKKTLYAPAVQKLSAVQDKLNIKFGGILADRLRVGAEFETAVESVFGEYLQAVFIESRETAEKIFKRLETDKIGRVNLLVFDEKENVTSKKKAAENRQTIGDILETSKELEKFLKEIFSVEMQTRIIENLAEAANFPNERCVTKTGEIIEKDRFFSLGKKSGSGQNTGILTFKRELRELEERAGELKKRAEIAEIAVSEAKNNLQNAEREISKNTAEIAEAERNLMTAEMSAKSFAQEIQRAERHLRVVTDEKKRLEKEISDVENRRRKAVEDSQIAEAAKAKANDRFNEISSRLIEKRKVAETINTNLSRRRAEFAAAGERRRSLANALRRSESEEVELKASLKQKSDNFTALDKQFEELKREAEILKSEIVTNKDTKQAEVEKIAEATDKVKKLREKSDSLAEKLKEANRLSAQFRDARAGLEVRQAESQTRLENLQAICLQELNVSLQTLAENKSLPDNFNLAEERSALEDLREKLDNFGAVNMLALEELSEAEERLLFLTGQKKDVVNSILSAEEALGEIKNRSRERFKDAFEAINQNFTEFFSQIFGGGRGEMNLLEAEDILEAGIEIVAQPPGKRLQNILLLSGGEKAMTAIALVLAIFKYRPSPFCLLDEVDAPLDEANVDRFVEKIEEMSGKTQFIIITHNKRTMESARALYGVTMEEAGISKVVSVKFE